MVQKIKAISDMASDWQIIYLLIALNYRYVVCNALWGQCGLM